MRTVIHRRIETPGARVKLKRGRQTHYQSLIAGKASLGYIRAEDAPHGRWFLRRTLGVNKYAIVPLGAADDERGVEADGETVLDFEQARTKALKVMGLGNEPVAKGALTVRKAFARYITYLENAGQRTHETERRAAALILPELGDLKVSELTSDRIRKWHSDLARRPALLRSKEKATKRNTKAAPGNDPEAIRKRRSTANRILTMLKAALNHAYDEKLVSDNSAWGRRVKPFENVDAARTRYLSVAEAKRLLNACEPSFRALVQAALETGCRYGELIRLVVSDFNPDPGAVAIQKSKSGKSRNVLLSPEGVAFFRQVTLGRKGTEILLRNDARVERALERERQRLDREGKDPTKASADDTGEWRDAEQGRLMREACAYAKIEPALSFHGLRHSWCSLAIMHGLPLMIAARNMGHRDTTMVERHYGHLSPGYVAEMIQASAPRFGFVADKKVAVLEPR